MSMFSSIINSVKSLGSGSSQDFPFTIGDEILEFTRSRDAGLVWKLHLGKQTVFVIYIIFVSFIESNGLYVDGKQG